MLASTMSLSAQKGVQAYPAADAQKVKPGALVYSLPATTLTFKVKVAHHMFKSGPYAQYAQKYLGISDAQQANENFYTILRIKAGSFESADPTQLYIADAAPGTDLSFLELTKKGLIVPTAFVTQAPVSVIAPKEQLTPPAFTDLGVDPNIYKENATFFSGIKMDTSYVKVPVQKNMLVEKSPESRAADAANFIFSLRKRRVDLISGDIDNVFNNGEALKVALNEISRLEKEYLSLFIGKTYVDTATYVFEVTPKPEGGKSTSILFRFSESKGVMGENDLAGRPVMVDIASTNAVQQLPTTITEKSRDYILARYPEVCSVRVVDGKDILYSSNMAISQFGKVVQMPLIIPTPSKR